MVDLTADENAESTSLSTLTHNQFNYVKGWKITPKYVRTETPLIQHKWVQRRFPDFLISRLLRRHSSLAA